MGSSDSICREPVGSAIFDREMTLTTCPFAERRLIFSGVSRLKTPRRLPKRFEIGKVFLGQRSYTRQDYCELMIVDGWGNDLITLRAKNPFIDVSLEDVEEPV